MRSLPLVVVVAMIAVAAAGCAGAVPPDVLDAELPPDLFVQPVEDLARPDLAADLATSDLARPDLAVDLARPDLVVDLARPDLVVDLARPDLLMPDLLCVPRCDPGLCGSNGCGGTCTCPAGEGCVAGRCRLIPNSWASPGLASRGLPGTGGFNSSYARPFRLGLAADDPAAMIYYTTDGTDPTRASAGGLTPQSGILISTSSTVKWFAATAAGNEVVHADFYGVDAALRAYAGYVVEDLSLAGQGAVYTTGPGAQVSASITYQTWVQMSLPNAGLQLVYGVDDESQGCLYDGSPKVYPGVGPTQKSFIITAPVATGVHYIRIAYIEELTCNAALAKSPIATRPNTIRVGTLIVQ